MAERKYHPTAPAKEAKHVKQPPGESYIASQDFQY